MTAGYAGVRGSVDDVEVAHSRQFSVLDAGHGAGHLDRDDLVVGAFSTPIRPPDYAEGWPPLSRRSSPVESSRRRDRLNCRACPFGWGRLSS